MLETKTLMREIKGDPRRAARLGHQNRKLDHEKVLRNRFLFSGSWGPGTNTCSWKYRGSLEGQQRSNQEDMGGHRHLGSPQSLLCLELPSRTSPKATMSKGEGSTVAPPSELLGEQTLPTQQETTVVLRAQRGGRGRNTLG